MQIGLFARALGGGAILAAVACALPAGAAPGGPPPTVPIKHYHVAIPLPKDRHGTIRLVDATVRLPSNVKVTGSPFLLSVRNGAKLPCYIRAAAMTIQKPNGLWRIYVAINAPKGLVQCRAPASAAGAASDTKLNLDVGVVAPTNQYPTTVKEQPGDACKALKHERAPERESTMSLLGSSTWREIRDRAENGDGACP